MTALSAAKSLQLQEIGAGKIAYPMVDNIKIWKGGLVALTSAGLAHAAADTAGYTVVGIAEESRDNTVTGHAAGSPGSDVSMNWIEVRVNVLAVMVFGGTATQAMVGTTAYVVDDATVLNTIGTNSIVAGKIVEFISATSVKVHITGV